MGRGISITPRPRAGPEGFGPQCGFLRRDFFCFSFSGFFFGGPCSSFAPCRRGGSKKGFLLFFFFLFFFVGLVLGLWWALRKVFLCFFLGDFFWGGALRRDFFCFFFGLFLGGACPGALGGSKKGFLFFFFWSFFSEGLSWGSGGL